MEYGVQLDMSEGKKLNLAKDRFGNVFKFYAYLSNKGCS